MDLCFIKLAASYNAEETPLNNLADLAATVIRHRNQSRDLNNFPEPSGLKSTRRQFLARGLSLPLLFVMRRPGFLGPISSTSIGARPATSTASSRAKSRPICRCRRR